MVTLEIVKGYPDESCDDNKVCCYHCHYCYNRPMFEPCGHCVRNGWGYTYTEETAQFFADNFKMKPCKKWDTNCFCCKYYKYDPECDTMGKRNRAWSACGHCTLYH